MSRRITAQVCAVNKGLLSVKKIIQAGNRVVFEQGNSYIEDLGTKDKMYMEEKQGMFMIRFWRHGEPEYIRV